MDDISLGLYPGLRLCPMDLTTNHGLLRCPSLYCGASLDSFSQAVATSLPTPPPTSSRPPTPSPSLYCGASLDSFSQAVATSLPTPPPTSSRPPPPQYAGPKLVHTFKKTI